MMAAVRVGGETRLINAIVDHEDLDELRPSLVAAGAAQIVLSEVSLYTRAPRVEVARGQRRIVEFDPRLRIEVTAAECDVPGVVQAIGRIPGASTYVQVIDAGVTNAGSQSCLFPFDACHPRSFDAVTPVAEPQEREFADGPGACSGLGLR
jgi:nitrogen regulatory protein PII